MYELVQLWHNGYNLSNPMFALFISANVVGDVIMFYDAWFLLYYVCLFG